MNKLQRFTIVTCSLFAVVSCKSIPLSSVEIPVSFPESREWSVSNDETKSLISGKDLFIWSNEKFRGDLEISFTAKSDKVDGEISFLLFGSGARWEDGLVIINVSSDYRAIRLNSVYRGGYFLDHDDVGAFGNTDQHDVRLEIRGQSLKVFVDGEKKLSANFSRNINRTGKIGFYKYWDRPAVEISNLIVKQLSY